MWRDAASILKELSSWCHSKCAHLIVHAQYSISLVFIKSWWSERIDTLLALIHFVKCFINLVKSLPLLYSTSSENILIQRSLSSLPLCHHIRFQFHIHCFITLIYLWYFSFRWRLDLWGRRNNDIAVLVFYSYALMDEIIEDISCIFVILCLLFHLSIYIFLNLYFLFLD